MIQHDTQRFRACWLAAKGLEVSNAKARHVAHLNAYWSWRLDQIEQTARWSLALARAKEEAARVELFRRSAYDQGRSDGYRSGYDQRSKECTKTIDPGDKDSVWLTPRPKHDILRVAPKLDWAIPFPGPSSDLVVIVFDARTIAECYDGVTYRQVLWERRR